ncbi:long-chain fatty acid--CoA ligase [Shewanella xiamenensis]|uniref:long-chain-fatty-acid--CoA ligase n=1 Tax=Shewanella xiamenensis TaxID=332186 RepID=UPI001CC5CB43|nr:long-chain fatty acid--CoA ligase [Shewanella xiamenensis]MCT8860190.1 long-chain fatty acid--CoA ligase [Shewanella xiamenensis]UWG65563.1 long-chain fatty acid--CoA ligase [Shewanella xiamenensis]BDA61933.1 long-chain-fatty-acid--CoA ligase [Shewanella xiamenensis]
MAYDQESQLELGKYSSLIDLIERTSQRFGDKTAYACLGKSSSFNEIERDSRYFAAYLQNNTNLKPGDRIAIQLPNITQFVIAAYGALRAGLILVNTNPLYTERELIHQFNDSGAKALVVLSDLLPTLAKVVATTPIELVISTHSLDLIDPQVQPKTGLKNVEFCHVLKQGAELPFTRFMPALGDLAALQYTGGTTGLSKGAMLTHGNMLANAAQVKSRIGSVITEGEDTFVAPLPIYHIYAFMVNLVLYFECGGCSVLIPNPRDINGLIKTLAKYPFTGFAGLNTLFVALCHQPEFKALDFSHLKITISGGTALTAAAANLWQQTTGNTISEGYGLSETSPVISLNAPGYQKIGTIGKPVLGTEVKLLDENGNEVAQGEAGELAARGPQVMLGYWNNPQETANVMTADGFFKTGDIAILNEEGFHQIVDRKKDMIIVSGFNVYPNEVENVLASHPNIIECAVVGVKDEHSGEAVKAFVVLKDDSQDHEQMKTAILNFCREQLTAYKLPKLIEFMPQLPKSTVGKILRRELKNQP